MKIKAGDMVTLKSCYSKTDLFSDFSTTEVIGVLDEGVVCLILEIHANIAAKLLLPTEKVGWLPIGWLTKPSAGSVRNDTEN